jgi:ubiquinone/menaquinone biosynthesis C-methylase UbiE
MGGKVNLKKLQAEVPFDQYSRQYQVMTILNEMRKPGEKYKVLDVGGYKGRTADFLSTDTVTVIDLYDVDEPNYIKGSALEIPLEDKSVDFVTSFDVLEHIPAPKREKFFDECSRVAKKGVIICAPHKTPANEYAEMSLNDFYQKLHGEPHPWLKEHIEYGIPNFQKMETYAKQKGFHTVAFPSNKTRFWLSMQHAIFINSKHSLAAESLIALNAFYNQNFEYDGGNSADESYRLILCSFTEEATQKRVSKKFELINRDIDPLQEIKLFEKLGEFHAALEEKTSNLAGDYKDLHQHELKRANELEKNGKALWEQINQLDAKLAHPLRYQINAKLKHKTHKHTQ